MLVQENTYGLLATTLTRLIDELKKELPNLEMARVYSALAALTAVSMNDAHEKKIQEAEELGCPSVEIEWEVYQPGAEDKTFCAAVAMRRQSDMLLRSTGRDLDDPDFLDRIGSCELVIID